MPVRDIKTRFKLEGEATYKKTMSEVASAIKGLTIEEKLAEAQFKATGDAQEYAKEKARILNEKIAEQQKAVAAAEEALKALTDNGVSPSSKEFQAWKNKLVTAKTGLLNLQTRLNNLGTEMTEETEATNTAAGSAVALKEAIDKVGESVDTQNAIESLESITDTLESIISTAAQAAKAVWEAGLNASQWADDLATAASEAGIDVETYQSWQYASRFIDTNVEDIVKSWKDIDNALAQDGDAFKNYERYMTEAGIAIRDTSGHMRAGKDVFWDAVDYLHGIADEQERSAAAAKLFGNDWRKLNPLIDAGSAAYREMADEGRSVAVVSEANVEALGGLDDEYQKFTAGMEKLKLTALAALAPTFKDIAQAMGTAVQALNDFLASEEGRAALDAMKEALSGIITSFLGDDNGQGSFKAIVDGAKGAVEGFTTAMKWVSENGNTVADILKGIGGAFVAMKVSEGVLTFMTLIKSLPMDKLSALFGGAGAASAAAGTPVTTPVSAPAAAPSAVNPGTAAAGSAAAAKAGLGSKIVGFLSSGLAKWLGGIGIVIYETTKVTDTASDDWDAIWDKNGNPTSAGRAQGITWRQEEDPGWQEAQQWQEEQKRTKAIEEQDKAIRRAAAAQEYWDALRNDDTSQAELQEKYAKFLEAYEGDLKSFFEIQDKIEALLKDNGWSGEGIEDLPSEWFGIGADAAQGLADGLTGGTAAVQESSDALAQEAILAAKEALDEHSPSKEFEIIGGNAAVGLAQGIYDRGDEAIRAARWLAQSVERTVQSALDIHSPSKVFERLGAFTGLGFAQGIEGSAADVDRAVSHMLGATARKPVLTLGGVAVPGSADLSAAQAAGRNPAAPDAVHVTLVLDEDVLGDVMAPIVNEKIGARLQAVRR